MNTDLNKPRNGSLASSSPSAVGAGGEILKDESGMVRLEQIAKTFGNFEAVRATNLTLQKGTLTSLLGPSGCGKTTLLRLIAGLEQPSMGKISIRGRSVLGLPIHKRNVGLVFQNYALFPHKTVRDNIAFGLKHRGVSKSGIAEKVKQALDIVRLPGNEDRYPNQLSGGQQQRVALARAVVFEPDVLLLDEPLSALDANLREEMQVEIKRIQRSLGVTTILVTHDQDEALAMSDEIVVMNQGEIQQIGDPRAVYKYPRNRFVAGFIGQSNVFDCVVADQIKSQEDIFCVRLSNGLEINAVPQTPKVKRQLDKGFVGSMVIRGADITMTPTLQKGGGVAKNILSGIVVDSSYLGNEIHYLVDVSSLTMKVITNLTQGGSNDTQTIKDGIPVSLKICSKDCVIVPSN